MLLLESIKNFLSSLGSKLLLQSLSNLCTNFFHDLHIRSLCHLCANFYHMSSLRGLSHLSLSDILIENLLIKLLRITVNKSVIEFSTMRLNDIALARWGAISQLIRRMVSNLPEVIVHHFLVSEGCILQLDKPLGWTGMLSKGRRCNTSATTAVFPYVVVHNPVEAIVITSDALLLSDWKHFIQQIVILLLNSSCLILKIFISKSTIFAASSWRVIVLMLFGLCKLANFCSSCRWSNLEFSGGRRNSTFCKWNLNVPSPCSYRAAINYSVNIAWRDRWSLFNWGLCFWGRFLQCLLFRRNRPGLYL